MDSTKRDRTTYDSLPPVSSPEWQNRDTPDGYGSKITCRLALAVFSAVLGMFQFGYQITVINAPKEVISSFYNESYSQRFGQPISKDLLELLWALTVAITAVGGMIGALAVAPCSDKLGRKVTLMYNTILGMVAAVLMFTAKDASSFEMVIIGRFIIGIHCGVCTALVPVYNSEISTATIRGAVGTLNQLAVTVGLLTAQVLGLDWVLGSTQNWPYLLGVPVIAAVLQLILLAFCPESPRYLLLMKKDDYEAITALKQLRGCDDVTAEIQEMHEEKEALQDVEQIKILKLCSYQSLRLPLAVAIVMHLSQQLSGINCIFFYSTTLFENLGLALHDAQLASLAVGGIMVLMTIITVPMMDRVGRKILHLTGIGGMFIFSIVFTVAFQFTSGDDALEKTSIASALIFVFFFALGPGPIPWMIVPEFFSQGPRQAAVSVGVMFNWLSLFVVGLTFEYLLDVLQQLVFIPFTVLLLFFFLFLYFLLPETKGKSYEEVAHTFQELARQVGCSTDTTTSESRGMLTSEMNDSCDSNM